MNEQDLIAYLEKTLPAAERARVEAELERDPHLRRQLVQQSQLDAALRAALGPAANERVKQSVLAVLRGEADAALKQRVLADTNFATRDGSRGRPATFSILHLLSSLVRRPAFGFSFVAALVLLVVWFAQHPTTTVVDIELPTRIELDGNSTSPKSGETIRAAANSSATVKFADGTALHLEPATEIQLVAVASPARNGGKQLKLLAGSLSADVARQPPGLPLLIQTPHALITVVGTEFDLNVATNQTALEVTHGLVKMTEFHTLQSMEGTGVSNSTVSVAAGEFAVAAPLAPMRYGRLARNPLLWPFSSASIWNRPLGSDAQFTPVPGKSFLADGPLVGAMRPRRAVMGGAAHPLRGVWVGGERVADARLAEADLPPSGNLENLLLFQHARRYALELRGVTVRADGDLAAQAIARTDLAGPGISDPSTKANPFGFSQLGGLLHAQELREGIQHALACRVKRDRLGGRNNFQTPSTVWPATGGDEASGEFLNIGTLLAIPPDMDVKKLFGDSGSAYELARAVQDYGVYVTGYGDAPFALLRADRFMSAEEEDALVNRLVPLLQVVMNNSPALKGAPRRAPAPALPGEMP